ncbi:beta-1-3, beta-1-6-glucan biosynthesis protein [Nitrobacter sp.]|uniref:beta-1-3, beta-1-6-glucan biosynthesis protein n=1 Tax=unclassified Nitrobacter TaxID=2620411 RepID=UPI002C70F780|nr:beta-1-3, beta-1-6-glucan biosynthesis protein [Nitrobacter sp.]
MRRMLFGFEKALWRGLAVPGFALLFGIGGAIAQSGDLRAQDQNKQAAENGTNAADGAKDSKRKTDEFVEAARVIDGPAGNPECVWLGRRVVVLMWRDDLDTAFRHLDLYDRFGCPGGHVQASFRCLVRFGPIDPKAPDALSGRVHACWINPDAQPSGPDSAASPPAGHSTPAPATPAPQQPAPAPANPKKK